MVSRLIFSFMFFCLLAVSSQQAFAGCGKLANALLKYDPKTKAASFEKFYFTGEEFCDGGVFETNANLEIQLVDKAKKIIVQKYIFMNSFTVLESHNKKNDLLYNKTRLIQDPQFRNVKFALNVGPSLISHYNIITRTDKKLIGTGVVK